MFKEFKEFAMRGSVAARLRTVSFDLESLGLPRSPQGRG
jgi:hypothetical protein